MTLDQVKSDLKEIQYYYAKQKELDGASRTIGATLFDLISSATANLYPSPTSLLK